MSVKSLFSTLLILFRFLFVLFSFSFHIIICMFTILLLNHNYCTNVQVFHKIVNYYLMVVCNNLLTSSLWCGALMNNCTLSNISYNTGVCQGFKQRLIELQAWHVHAKAHVMYGSILDQSEEEFLCPGSDWFML